MKAGIYVSEGDAADVTVVLDRAKLACESIKRLYDQSYCYFDASMEEGAKLRQYIVSRFESAMARGEIRVYYQPEVRVLTRQICGFEALQGGRTRSTVCCRPEYSSRCLKSTVRYTSSTSA